MHNSDYTQADASKFEKETIGTNENVQGSVITYEDRGDRTSVYNQSIGGTTKMPTDKGDIGLKNSAVLKNVDTSGTGIQQMTSDINKQEKKKGSGNKQ